MVYGLQMTAGRSTRPARAPSHMIPENSVLLLAIRNMGEPGS